MQSKRAFLTLLAVALGGLALVGGVNALVDPLHILHRPLFWQARFSTDQRYQVPGLIDSYLAHNASFDTIVVGTSLDSGYNATIVQERLGTGAVMNLTMNNSTPKERHVVMERALATGHVRRVLLGVFQNYADAKADSENPEHPMPYGLYEGALTPQGLGARLQYLWSVSVLKDSAALAMGRLRWSTDMVSVFDWNPGHIAGRDFERFNAPDKLAGYAQSIARGKAAIAQATRDLDLPQTRRLEFPALEKHLAAVVRRHPDVHFDLILAPVSALFFHELTAEQLTRQLAMRRQLVRELGRDPNVRIFAFDTDWEVTGNLANYRDSTHACYLANNRSLAAMAAGGGSRRLTPDNVDAYLKDLLDGLLQYQLRSDREHSLWTAAAPAD